MVDGFSCHGFVDENFTARIGTQNISNVNLVGDAQKNTSQLLFNLSVCISISIRTIQIIVYIDWNKNHIIVVKFQL